MTTMATHTTHPGQVERLRKLAKQWREGDAEAFRSLNKEVSQLSTDEHYHVRVYVVTSRAALPKESWLAVHA